MPLELDTELPEWQQWASKHPHEGNAIPIVFVIRADGQSLHSKSGSPEELPAFLVLLRKQAGNAITPKQAEALAKTVEEGTKAFDGGDVGAAIKLLAKAPGQGSYAKAAVAAAELGQKLFDHGKAALEKADQQLSGDDEALEGALALLEVERLFKSNPDLVKQAREVRTKHQKEKRELLAQADALDNAIEFEAQKATDKALRAFLNVVEKFPGTPAATLAQENADRLKETGVKVASTPGAAPPKTGATGTPAAEGPTDANLKKAESRLRLGKSLIKSRPATAVEYLEEVVTLAPGTEMAKEAEALLKELR